MLSLKLMDIIGKQISHLVKLSTFSHSFEKKNIIWGQFCVFLSKIMLQIRATLLIDQLEEGKKKNLLSSKTTNFF